MVQLWVNLPGKYKMSSPKYQANSHTEMKIVDLDENGSVEVIAGEYESQKRPASTFTPLHLMNAKLNTGGKAKFIFPAKYYMAVLVIAGNVIIDGEHQVATDHVSLFENQGESFKPFKQSKRALF